MGSTATLPVIHSGTKTAAAVAAIRSELSYQFLERDDEILGIVLALMAGENVIAYGEPGTGKTDLMKAVSSRLTGAKHSRFLMDRQMDKSEMLGMLDLAEYQRSSRFVRSVTDTIYDCDTLYLDEVDKTGPGVTTPLLTAINEGEGNYGNGWQKLPMLTAMGSANHELEDGQEAFADRFLVTLVFRRLQQPDNVLALLESQLAPRTPANPTTVPVDDVRHAIEYEVPAVRVPRAVLESMVEINKELEREQLFPSNRRLKACVKLVQANAWLGGRDEATEDDLEVLRFALWSRQDDRAKVTGIVLRHTGPVTRLALELTQAVVEAGAEIDALVADGSTSADTLASTGGKLQTAANRIDKRIKAARKEHADRDLTRLDEVDALLFELRVRIFVQMMRQDEDVARSMLEAGRV